MVFVDALADGVEDLLGGVDADVGAEQDFLELVPELIVDFAAIEDAGNAAEPASFGARDGGLGLLLGEAVLLLLTLGLFGV